MVSRAVAVIVRGDRQSSGSGNRPARCPDPLTMGMRVRSGPRPPGTRTGSCPGGAPARPRSASLLIGASRREEGITSVRWSPLDRARA